MHVPPLVHGRDLDARQELQAVCRGRHRGLRHPGHRVVVGDTQRLDADRVRALYESRRGQGAVRRGRVQVKVDQGVTP